MELILQTQDTGQLLGGGNVPVDGLGLLPVTKVFCYGMFSAPLCSGRLCGA